MKPLWISALLLWWCFCVGFTFSGEATAALPKREVSKIPIYRGAEPFLPNLEAVEKWSEQYPESMRPWKEENLKDVKIYLPLGEGESIKDKYYRFTASWGERTDKSLHIGDLRFRNYSHLNESENPAQWNHKLRYRPVELVKENVVRCKFEFRPLKFRPLDPALLEFTAENLQNTKNQAAPKPEFLDPIPIHTAQMKILVNGKNDGFDVHFSRDGTKWYGMRDFISTPMIPLGILPFETFYVRIATEKDEEEKNVPIKSFSLDFEAILETPGFRGTGETLIGKVSEPVDKRKKAIRCPLAFWDENNDLKLMIDNDENEPLSTGSSYSHSISNRNGMGGTSFGDGFFFGPTIPPKSYGVATLTTSKKISGNHTYNFSIGTLGFNIKLSVPKIDYGEPYPLPNFSPYIESKEELSRKKEKEHKPQIGKPPVSFDDDV